MQDFAFTSINYQGVTLLTPAIDRICIYGKESFNLSLFRKDAGVALAICKEPVAEVHISLSPRLQ